MARRYDAGNDPIRLGLESLRQGIAQNLANRRAKEENELRARLMEMQYGPTDISPAIINMLPESSAAPLRERQVQEASPEEKASNLNRMVGELASRDRLFGGEEDVRPTARYTNSVRVSRPEADIYKEMAVAQAKKSGTFDQRTIRPQFQALVDKIGKKDENLGRVYRAGDIVPPENYLTVAESAMLNGLRNDERNEGLRLERERKFEEDRRHRSETERIAKENLNLGQRAAARAETAGPNELAPANAAISHISELTNLLREAKDVKTGYGPAGLALVENMVSSATGGEFPISENTNLLNRLKAGTSKSRIAQVYASSGKAISDKEMAQYDKFEISDTDTLPQRVAKVQGTLSLMKSAGLTAIRSAQPKTPRGLEGKEAELGRASKDLEAVLADQSKPPPPKPKRTFPKGGASGDRSKFRKIRSIDKELEEIEKELGG